MFTNTTPLSSGNLPGRRRRAGGVITVPRQRLRRRGQYRHRRCGNGSLLSAPATNSAGRGGCSLHPGRTSSGQGARFRGHWDADSFHYIANAYIQMKPDFSGRFSTTDATSLSLQDPENPSPLPLGDRFRQDQEAHLGSFTAWWWWAGALSGDTLLEDEQLENHHFSRSHVRGQDHQELVDG